MIKHYLITGDTHGSLARFSNINTELYKPEETAIIILGDVGFNYYLDERDTRLKRRAQALGFTFYCVRGNHESRPVHIKGMEKMLDNIVENYIYIEPEFPNIRYLIDGYDYFFLGSKTLVIGGAYSVDKDYRLARGWAWWADEQLDPKVQCGIMRRTEGEHYDFVLTHTCPYSWEPRELFLDFIDQSSVDNSTETWLEEIERKITYNFWLFGHFHADKIVNNNAAMLYEQVLDLHMIKPIDNYTEIPEGFIV